MKVMVIGLRGIPGIQGGVETHVEHLYPLLIKLGCEVEVIARSSSIPSDHPRNWKGIEIHRLWSPKTTGVESFVHTFLAVLYAALRRPDILHIHAIGPAIMTPLARILGLTVVVTHHGPDYDREKWNKSAKKILFLGEKWGMEWSNQRIVISKVIQKLVNNKYDKDSALIPNGVAVNKIPNTKSCLDKFKLSPGKYVLQVSRLVPEKRQLDLIHAFLEADIPEWKLVLVGKLNPNENYTQKLLLEAQNNNNIVLTDFQTGLSLQELLAHAGIFVLPSSHEGLPIAMLEALSFGLRVVASDIPANLEVELPEDQYFSLGNVNQLATILQFFANKPLTKNEKKIILDRVEERYNWQSISKQTLTVYQKCDRKNQ